MDTTLAPTVEPPLGCLEYEVWVEQNEFVIDTIWIGGAFGIGILVGAIIAVLCAKLCWKDIAKKKLQDAERGYTGAVSPQEKAKKLQVKTRPKTARAKSSKKRLQSGKKKKGAADEPLVPIVPVTLEEVKDVPDSQGDFEGDPNDPLRKGLIDALVNNTESAQDAEIMEQDLESINTLERELKEEGIMTMIQLMRTLLGQQLNKGKLKPEQVQDVMKDMQDSINGVIKQNQGEKAEEEQEIMKIKDPEKRQAELEKLHSKYNTKLNSMLQSEKDNFRQLLSKNSDLSEAEIEALIAAYNGNMASLENKLGVERTRQAANLEDRLAKRKQYAESQNIEHKAADKEEEFKRDMNQKMLQVFVDDGKLVDRQKDELLKQYDHDVDLLKKKQQEEMQRQKLKLSEKLKRNREEKMRRLQEDQEIERENFVRKADKIVEAKDLVDSHHDLLQQQRIQREDLNAELDHFEAEEMNRLRTDIESDTNRDMHERQEKFNDDVQTKAQISDKDFDRMLRIHQQEMEEFDRSKRDEKKRMKAMLAEKLAARRAKVEQDQAKMLAEQKVVKEQQDATLQKVLESQLELDADSKKKIMKEHEQNLSAINNQLQMSKLRQQKAMEQKLNKRKAKIEELHKKKDDLEKAKREGRIKEKEKLEADLERQIEEEERKLEEDRHKNTVELRERFAAETEAALSEQEKQLSALIARLEVGQARRQALIKRQDKTIKELENQISSKVESDPNSVTDREVDYVLQQHMNQVSHLNEQLQDAREQQDQKLKEKLEAKRLKKEREVENKVENEASAEWKQAKQRGAGLATALMSQIMLEQRHKMAMQQLEKEMHIELQKQRDELNDELEAELKKELAEQKKNFLQHVAAMSRMSKDEINQLVDSAVVGSGGDEKEAKKLAKEMRIGVQRAKTELGVNERD